MSGYVMKARLTPSFEKKIMPLACLTVMVFSQNRCLQKVFKMITAAACEGPSRCEAMEQNPLPFLPSIFNLAPDKLSHQHKNMTVLQLIGLEKYENVRTA